MEILILILTLATILMLAGNDPYGKPAMQEIPVEPADQTRRERESR